MTRSEIKTLLKDVDPNIRHHYSMRDDGADYTVWEETEREGLIADDHHAEEGWKFYVHRFTKNENDPIAAALFLALDAAPEIGVSEEIDHEPETGYIHHIYTCECA